MHCIHHIFIYISRKICLMENRSNVKAMRKKKKKKKPVQGFAKFKTKAFILIKCIYNISRNNKKKKKFIFLACSRLNVFFLNL